jgi:hypothetical protein
MEAIKRWVRKAQERFADSHESRLDNEEKEKTAM